MTWPAAIGVWTNAPLLAKDSIRPCRSKRCGPCAEGRAKRAFTGSLGGVRTSCSALIPGLVPKCRRPHHAPTGRSASLRALLEEQEARAADDVVCDALCCRSTATGRAFAAVTARASRQRSLCLRRRPWLEDRRRWLYQEPIRLALEMTFALIALATEPMTFTPPMTLEFGAPLREPRQGARTGRGPRRVGCRDRRRRQPEPLSD